MLEKFLQAPVDRLIENELYKHDLVDVTRQFVQNKMEMLYPRIKVAFSQKSVDDLRTVRQTFEEMLTLLDEALGTSQQFLLGKWLTSAKSLATN